MTGKEYSDLVASYLVATYADRGLRVFREVNIGKSVIGKNRRIDVFAVCGDKALAIECKFQQTSGTTDEKIPYALKDVAAMWVPAVIVYSGDGWSDGVRHMLRSDTQPPIAAAPEYFAGPSGVHLAPNRCVGLDVFYVGATCILAAGRLKHAGQWYERAPPQQVTSTGIENHFQLATDSAVRVTSGSSIFDYAA